MKLQMIGRWKLDMELQMMGVWYGTIDDGNMKT